MNFLTRIHSVLLIVSVTLILGCNSGSGPNTPGSRLVRVSMRVSQLDSDSAVLQLKNVSNQTIPGMIIVGENLDSRQRFWKDTGPLEPGATMELGILEISWQFLPNERIIVMVWKPGVTVPDKITTEVVGKHFSVDVYETYRAGSGIIGIKHIRGH